MNGGLLNRGAFARGVRGDTDVESGGPEQGCRIIESVPGDRPGEPGQEQGQVNADTDNSDAEPEVEHPVVGAEHADDIPDREHWAVSGGNIDPEGAEPVAQPKTNLNGSPDQLPDRRPARKGQILAEELENHRQ